MQHSTSIRRDTTMSTSPQKTATPPRPPQKGLHFGVWLRTATPTVLVIGLLVGVAYWGHSTDWSLPKFSALLGKQAEEKTDWCEEHNVPESQCIECNKNLAPALPDYGWCPVHGIAQCPLEHPDVAQLEEQPTVTGEDLQRASKALATLPREENNPLCKMYQKRLQFASAEAVAKVGVDIAMVDRRPIIDAVTANGEIVYDETHTAHLASRAPGTIWQVEKQVGQQVEKGEVLALIESAGAGRAKADLLQAIAESRVAKSNVDRLQPLASSGAVAGKLFHEAQASLQEAEIKFLSARQSLVNLGLPVKADEFVQLTIPQIAKQIQFLGLPESLTAKFDQDSTTSNLLPLRSPLKGVVVDSKIVAGETVDTSTSIFTITDLRSMWLFLGVRQDDARRLLLGQGVLFRSTEAKDGPDIHGSIAWISTAVDDKTRTVKLRVDLPNPDGTLRANTFGTGRIVLREEPQAIVVPSDAIHSDGDCHVVFVRDKNYLKEGAPKFFHVREVRLGAKDGDLTEIIAGVLPGEIVASKNSAVLEAQLLKGNIADGD
jgi:membrane fusion protein, heavy metal efflux system